MWFYAPSIRKIAMPLRSGTRLFFYNGAGVYEDELRVPLEDADTLKMVEAVAMGRCPPAILADWLEERYGLAEMARILRACNQVGEPDYRGLEA